MLVDLEFAEAADGRWNSRVQIVDQAAHELHSESTLSLDGTPGMSSGTYWVTWSRRRCLRPACW